ncbi:MAG: 30S ribosomal protein S17 [Patescibacteria group bacterium]
MANIDSKQHQVAQDRAKPQKRKFIGVVVGNNMEKTLLVRVDRVKQHPKYKKRYTVSRKFKVHDEKQSFKVGDEVQFIECRPLSKHKRWRVLYN